MRQRLLPLVLGVNLCFGAAQPIHADLSADDVMTVTHKVRGGVMFMMIADETGRTIASGTGFIVSNDGKLVTNRHVADAGPRLVAKAPNGRLYRVRGLLLEDTDQDVVVLQLEDADLPALTLGASENVGVGTPVVMVGNPLAMESTVQQGTVSGFRNFLGARRWIEINAAVAEGRQDDNKSFIHSQGLQVATSVAHGSSGSPVFNAGGEVIGMITAIDHDRSGQAVALAIPVEVVKELVTKAAQLEPQPLGQSTRHGGNDLSSDPEYHAAVATIQAHDFGAAEQHAKAVVARFPDSAAGYLLLGNVYLQQRAGRDAIETFQHAIRINRSLAAAWAGLVMADLQSDLASRARDDLQELQKIDPATAKHLTDTVPALSH
jgi:S1-C subfamily serine protease